MQLEVWLKYTEKRILIRPIINWKKITKKCCNFFSVTDACCGLLVGDAVMLTSFKLGIVGLCNDTGCKYRLLISLSSVYKYSVLFSVSVSKFVSGEIKIHICAIEENECFGYWWGGRIMYRNPHCTNN